MRIILLLLLLLSLENVGFAQEEEAYVDYAEGNEKYHQFKVGTSSYLLADNVNVRATPSSKGSIVINLPIGTAVKIVEKSDKQLRINGFKTNWYKVSFKAENKAITAYVWGGLIAEGSVMSANSKVRFLYGIASFKTGYEAEMGAEQAMIQVRACKNKQQLSKIELRNAGNYLNIYHWLGNYGNKGLENVEDILEFGESKRMCAGLNAYNMIFWTGKKLVYATALYPGVDAPYYASDNLIFPSDKGGEKGKIIKEQIEGWYDDEKEVDVIERHKRVEYIWTGEKLKQTKVLIDKEYEIKD
jgi:uncharacterized protein YgiM (DUF1202 family)